MDRADLMQAPLAQTPQFSNSHHHVFTRDGYYPLKSAPLRERQVECKSLSCLGNSYGSPYSPRFYFNESVRKNL